MREATCDIETWVPLGREQQLATHDAQRHLAQLGLTWMTAFSRYSGRRQGGATPGNPSSAAAHAMRSATRTADAVSDEQSFAMSRDVRMRFAVSDEYSLGYSGTYLSA